MRLHRLTVTAFGPFAGSEHVDFDDLNDAGLFLLTGPTGAGKTSILDAVCFALYGSVPGARGVKALKSQHAAVDTAPEVVLDFSVRDRRFVVRRSPEWSRPKKKGTGFVAEKASATLVETTGGSDHFLSSRAQEVGHLIGELMGMNASQFVQVAMLPQGDFQKFLRATSDERHAVLQHLFRSERFTRIEDWVNDHSRGLRERAARGQNGVQRVLDTIAERAEVELPEHLSGDALGRSADDDRVLAWAAQVVTDAEARMVAGTAAHDQTRSAVAELRQRYQDAQRLDGTLTRRHQALDTLHRLTEDEATAVQARVVLETDGRAAPCLPVLRLLDEARTHHAAASARRDACLADARALDAVGATTVEVSDAPSSAEVDVLVRDLRAHATRLEALLPRERERREAEAALAAARTAVTEARADRDRLERRRRAIPEELAGVRERLGAATATAGRREALGLSLDAARSRLDAARRLPVLEAETVRLQDGARDCRDRLAAARERVQDLAERRLAGIAAELAGLLQDGRACQVCGSVDHPTPAEPRSDAVSEAEQQQAAADHDARTEEYAQAVRRVADAERRVASLREAAQGLDAAAAEAAVDSVQTALAEAEQAAAELAGLETLAADLVAEQEQVTRRAAELDLHLATLEQVATEQCKTIDRIGDEVAAATGDPATDLRGRLAGLAATVDVLTELASAVTAFETTAARAEELEGQARVTAADHGFGDLESARAAVLPVPERQRLEALLAERADAQARARAVLADPEVQAAGDQRAPDLDRLREVLADTEQADAEAARAHHHCEEQVAALRGLVERLRAALAEWAPVRERFVRAESMSKLVRGMGHDNRLQMRLSAYVLATRLDQVVAAANERLAHMRDQRYLLQRTGRAARKGAQAGLGLEVVDQWTGDVRDPATLSGGETFVVSLSLALGLADVVTQEAGGTEIDTLFVDEGFGTLDADTLDDVMDRLDGLRAGGRTVGVVSHVSEMRNRIPTQVHVEKRRTGSTVRVRTLAE
jgi:exonuclease SbcC